MTLAVNIAQSGSNNVTMRNRIINGAMMIDQRNAGASVTLNSGTIAYTLDRYGCNNQSGGNITVQQSTTAPAGFQNSLLVTVTSSNSPTSAQFGRLFQGIEGFNMSDLAWGTANAQPIAISFWVRSSVTGTHSMVLNNGAGSYAYPFTFTISAANTFEYKTVTIPGPTAGTWGTNNNAFCYLSIPFGSGSATTATANTWASASGFVNGATGSVNLIATNGATFYITGVQLEEGTAASPFENRLYGTELSLCYRYFQKFLGSSTYEALPSYVIAGSGTGVEGFLAYKGTMRSTPTLSISTLCLLDANGIFPISGASATNNGVDSMRITYSGISSLTQYRSYYVTANNSTSAFLTLSAEL